MLQIFAKLTVSVTPDMFHTLHCSATLKQQHLMCQRLIDGIIQYQADLVSHSKFACVR